MLQLTSPAFASGDVIPLVHTCSGDDTAPPLRWRAVPEGTRALALMMEDPDAPRGTFTHWLLADLPPTPAELPAPGGETAGVEGTNGFGNVGYGGPCPPRGDRPHRYEFRLYALDAPLGLEPGFSRDRLAGALEGHVLEEVELVGLFGRGG